MKAVVTSIEATDSGNMVGLVLRLPPGSEIKPGDIMVRSTLTNIAVKTEKTYHAQLSSADIIDALRALGHNIPMDARVSVKVPGGGDWSGLSLDFTEEKLDIVWKELTNSV